MASKWTARKPPFWALVRFFPDQKEWVSSTEDIINFNPSHPKDFKKGTKYKVKWQAASETGSFDGSYEAYILCMAVTLFELKENAAAAGIKKMPPNYETLLSKFSKKPPNIYEEKRAGTRKRKHKKRQKSSDPSSVARHDRMQATVNAVSSSLLVNDKETDSYSSSSSENERSSKRRCRELEKELAELKASLKADKVSDKATKLPVPAFEYRDVHSNSSGGTPEEIGNTSPSSPAGPSSPNVDEDSLAHPAKGSFSPAQPSTASTPAKQSDGSLSPAHSSVDTSPAHPSVSPLALASSAAVPKTGGLRSSKKSKGKIKGVVLDIPPGSLTRAQVCDQLYNDMVQVKDLPVDSENKVNLGNGVTIDKEVWEELKKQDKPSFYVKQLSQAHYGQAGLAKRTIIKPRKCTDKTKATPQKLETMLGAYRAYTKVKRGGNLLDEESLVALDKEAMSLLSSKMQDEARKK